MTQIEGNGENRFYCVVKCPYSISEEEWAQIVFLLNHTLGEFDGGKYSNVGAYMEENNA